MLAARSGIVATVFQIGKALEIVSQSNLFVTVKIVVAQCRENRNLVGAPHRGFRVPHFPVIFVVAVVDDIPGKTNKRGIGLSNRLDQRLPHRRIRRLGVFGIVEA